MLIDGEKKREREKERKHLTCLRITAQILRFHGDSPISLSTEDALFSLNYETRASLCTHTPPAQMQHPHPLTTTTKPQARAMSSVQDQQPSQNYSSKKGPPAVGPAPAGTLGSNRSHLMSLNITHKAKSSK